MLNISTNVILESTCTHLLLSLLLNCFLVKLFYQLWCFVKDSNYRIISFVRDLIPCFIFLFIIFYICSFGLEVSLVAKMLTCIERKFFKTKLKYLKICFISFKFIKSKVRSHLLANLSMILCNFSFLMWRFLFQSAFFFRNFKPPPTPA